MQVVFHLQTRRPAVLPPLCDLFGVGPGDPRPMQEGAPPDFALLEVGGGVGAVGAGLPSLARAVSAICTAPRPWLAAPPQL